MGTRCEFVSWCYWTTAASAGMLVSASRMPLLLLMQEISMRVLLVLLLTSLLPLPCISSLSLLRPYFSS